MKQLMKNMTNGELLDKLDYEGAEYFFLDYISLDSIQDDELRKNVQAARLVWEEILSVVYDLEDERYERD